MVTRYWNDSKELRAELAAESHRRIDLPTGGNQTSRLYVTRTGRGVVRRVSGTFRHVSAVLRCAGYIVTHDQE